MNTLSVMVLKYCIFIYKDIGVSLCSSCHTVYHVNFDRISFLRGRLIRLKPVNVSLMLKWVFYCTTGVSQVMLYNCLWLWLMLIPILFFRYFLKFSSLCSISQCLPDCFSCREAELSSHTHFKEFTTVCNSSPREHYIISALRGTVLSCTHSPIQTHVYRTKNLKHFKLLQYTSSQMEIVATCFIWHCIYVIMSAVVYIEFVLL